MAITQERADESPRKVSAPRQTAEHRVLHDLLGQRPLPGHQQDLRQDDPAVLAVERRHRVLVALADPAQQPAIAAGRVTAGGENRRAHVPVRIVHRSPL
jgi:hypothetical protein